jgi:hypothetical protein
MLGYPHAPLLLKNFLHRVNKEVALANEVHIEYDCQCYEYVNKGLPGEAGNDLLTVKDKPVISCVFIWPQSTWNHDKPNKPESINS